MANKPRTPEVIDFQKRRMSLAALDIIVKDGHSNLSIRKLAKRLNISPNTIYRYFKNQDEIFIYVLNAGFEMLYEEFIAAYTANVDPVEKLKAVCNAFFDFSIRERDLTFIMVIIDTPKYPDYENTEYEPFMRIEMANAFKCRDIFRQIMTDMAETYPEFPREEIHYHALSVMHRLIGLATIYNNRVMNYLYDDPPAGAKKILADISRPYEIIRNGRLQPSTG